MRKVPEQLQQARASPASGAQMAVSLTGANLAGASGIPASPAVPSASGSTR
jgi:hypothetical protein